MKKLIMLTSILLMTLMGFSQTDIKRDSVLVLPIPVAKKVVKDLILGDAAKEELILTKDVLKTTEEKSAVQGFIINEYKNKGVKYDSLLVLYNKQELTYDLLTIQLKDDLRKTKRKLFINRLGSTAIIGILTYLLITK